MLRVVKSICDFAISIGLAGAIGFYSLQNIGNWIKKKLYQKLIKAYPH